MSTVDILWLGARTLTKDCRWPTIKILTNDRTWRTLGHTVGRIKAPDNSSYRSIVVDGPQPCLHNSPNWRTRTFWCPFPFGQEANGKITSATSLRMRCHFAQVPKEAASR